MFLILAEFRGPGVHHNFDDSDSGYDLEEQQKQGKSFGLGGYRGRVIFLGDGTEVMTDSDDTEMFDNAEEDKDLVSQVWRGTSQDSPEAGQKAAAGTGAAASTETADKKADDKKKEGPAAAAETKKAA